jgi:TetR/AcrR family transcriptional regulator, mexJK operon transcriptional repressor
MKRKMALKQSKKKARRRVPRGAKRRAEIVAVAERVFLKRGFVDTTMQMIASLAGGSKETLYRHFKSKEALFAEIVDRRAALIAGPQSALARDEAPEAALSELGLSLMRLMMKSDTSSLLKIVVAEAPRSPQLAKVFYARGPGATLDKLTDYLRVATRRRQLDCPQPLLAAKLFIGSVVAQHHLYSLIGQPPAAPSESEMRKHVHAAVMMFLARYAGAKENEKVQRDRAKPKLSNTF